MVEGGAAAQQVSTVDKAQTDANIDAKWDDWYVPALGDFIRVPNLSPNYDAEFLTNGKMEQAI